MKLTNAAIQIAGVLIIGGIAATMVKQAKPVVRNFVREASEYMP